MLRSRPVTVRRLKPPRRGDNRPDHAAPHRPCAPRVRDAAVAFGADLPLQAAAPGQRCSPCDAAARIPPEEALRLCGASGNQCLSITCGHCVHIRGRASHPPCTQFDSSYCKSRSCLSTRIVASSSPRTGRRLEAALVGRRARLTAGGLTWDLRAPRSAHGDPHTRKQLPTREAEVRNHLEYDLTQLVAALKAGREARAWEILREARALARRLPRVSAAAYRRKLAAAETVLRSTAWRSQAADIRHGRHQEPGR